MSSEERVDEISVRKPGVKKATSKKKSSQRVLTLAEKYKVVKAINCGKKQTEVAQLFDTEAEKGQSKNILQIPKNILNRNIILKSLSKSLTNLKNYCKS